MKNRPKDDRYLWELIIGGLDALFWVVITVVFFYYNCIA